jgi:hypothetical protein
MNDTDMTAFQTRSAGSTLTNDASRLLFRRQRFGHINGQPAE